MPTQEAARGRTGHSTVVTDHLAPSAAGRGTGWGCPVQPMLAQPCSAGVTPTADTPAASVLPRPHRLPLGRDGNGPAPRGDRAEGNALERPPCRVPARACECRGKGVHSVRGLVGLDDAGRDAAPVAHRVPVLARPVADRTGL